MENASVPQESMSERLSKNTGAFKAAYERLNGAEQKEVQLAFCKRYRISPAAFRARLGGFTRTSDTELAWIETEVDTYFPTVKL